jgi:DNA-binding transcriptional ArsR family regulator
VLLIIYGWHYIRTVLTTFEVIAEPTRRRILDLLLAGERPVGELVSELAMSQPAVSRHLRVLRDAGLVASRTDAQRRLYRVDPAPLAAMDDWLRPYRRLWAGRLDGLARHLDAMDELSPDDGKDP